MRRALALARRGWGQTAPNPMVGAVVVRGGRVVGEGWHARYGGPHAEVVALRAAGKRARGSTVYVTLEPCAHWGKTPPCTDALVAAGVRRVVCATRDPNPGARGGAARLRRAGVAVEFGVEADAARELNAPFFAAFERPGLPWVTLKLAVAADGAVAPARGKPVRITGPRADREVHRMRAGVEAIAVGRGTAVADDPLLTVRHGAPPRIPPVRVVFDRTARLPLRLRLVGGAREIPTVVMATRPDQRRVYALFRAGVEVFRARGVRAALQILARHEVRSVLVEGGPTLAKAFLRARVVDRIVIFRS
ncbi:MAG: bifunctional diaminohydroxyphosphoribosylaminopyrimidine deaminase/5-amino-6-(5-phosphoribosylamino)uracil reductase RibD, partial [Gemmatimonadota bacterium]|nr:bifunctional diaminohydroxyphosphoribosylaminopyrimidine deaminase/5-amino-6-(5-phosphoribosylamino)uracil reductase RibD [Gemmatimonadota bacterium]